MKLMRSRWFCQRQCDGTSCQGYANGDMSGIRHIDPSWTMGLVCDPRSQLALSPQWGRREEDREIIRRGNLIKAGVFLAFVDTKFKRSIESIRFTGSLNYKHDRRLWSIIKNKRHVTPYFLRNSSGSFLCIPSK